MGMKTNSQFVRSPHLHANSLEKSSTSFSSFDFCFVLSLKMASASIALLQPTQCNSLLLFMSFGSYDEKCAEERGPLQKEYDINTLKTVATTNKKLGELITLLEANPSMEATLKQNGTNIRLGEEDTSSEENSTDSEDEENDEVMDVVAQRKIQLATIEFLSFVHKLWLRRIGLTDRKSVV